MKHFILSQLSRLSRIVLLVSASLALTVSVCSAQLDTGDATLDAVFDKLRDKDFSVKAEAIDELVESGHVDTESLLLQLLDGELFYIKGQPYLFNLGAKVDRKYTATDAVSGESRGEFRKRKFRKFTINNTLRRQIRSHIAALKLSSDDPVQRLAAVNELLDGGGIDDVGVLKDMLDKEQDDDVRQALSTALAIAQLQTPDVAERLAAIESIPLTLNPALRNKLKEISTGDADEGVQLAATQALAQIDRKVRLYGHLETFFFGLSLGSVLVLAAIGLAITFGVMGVINMAHGELIMLGAYTTWALQQLLPGFENLTILLAIPLAFLVSGCAGYIIERSVVRFLYGRPLDTLLATFGISLILQQLARTLISAQNVPVVNAPFLSGSLQVNSVLSITYSRLYIFVFCLLVFAALVILLKRTAFGLRVRAVSQNRTMARAVGIKSTQVDALTFALGAGIAGVAGVALSQLTNVGPNLGQGYIIDSFMVVVFGGVGNLWGTLIAGLGLGIANKVAEPWAGAVLAKILVLVFIILFIQKRPRGLFPQKGRAGSGT